MFPLDPDLPSARDPQLWRYVTENNPAGQSEITLSLAASYNTDLKPNPVGADEDNFLLYDQNFEGPYGRFGGWLMLASARSFPDSKGVESNVDCTGLWMSGNALYTQTSTDSGTVYYDAEYKAYVKNYATVTGPDKIASTIVQPTFGSLVVNHVARDPVRPPPHLLRPALDRQRGVGFHPTPHDRPAEHTKDGSHPCGDLGSPRS